MLCLIIHFCHTRFRVYLKKREVHAYKTGVIYRHIQLIAELCNVIQQKTVLTAAIAGTTFTSGFSLAILVLVPLKREFLLFRLMTTMTYFDTTLALLFSLDGMVAVYKEFKLVFQNLRWKYDDDMRGNQWS